MSRIRHIYKSVLLYCFTLFLHSSCKNNDIPNVVIHILPDKYSGPIFQIGIDTAEKIPLSHDTLYLVYDNKGFCKSGNLINRQWIYNNQEKGRKIQEYYYHKLPSDSLKPINADVPNTLYVTYCEGTGIHSVILNGKKGGNDYSKRQIEVIDSICNRSQKYSFYLKKR